MGVRPLDEEDVDHLNAYQESRDKKRRKREEEVRRNGPVVCRAEMRIQTDTLTHTHTFLHVPTR